MRKIMRSKFFIIFFAVTLFVVRVAHADVHVQAVTSPKGLTAWLVEDKTVPVITISFSFAGGMALDPENLPGVANLAASLMNEGAGDLDSKAFQEKLSDNAISLYFNASRDEFSGYAQTLSTRRAIA